MKEREERKQRRLLEERGLLPENELQPDDDAAEEEQCDPNAAGKSKHAKQLNGFLLCVITREITGKSLIIFNI